MKDFTCIDFCFNAKTGELTIHSKTVRLEPTVARLLAYFLENQGRLITRQELSEQVWQGKIVSDDPINRGVSILRQALATEDKQRYIRTVPRRGYEAVFPDSTHREISSNAANKGPINDAELTAHKLSARAPVFMVFSSLALICLLIGAWWLLHEPQKQSLPQAPVIAVLPFLDKSNEAAKQYIGDGISDALIASLSKVKDIKVIARTSSFVIDQKAFAVKQIAERLSADYLLEGSVIEVRGQVKVSARLIDAKSETLVWSSEFTNPMSDTLFIQEEISSATIFAIVGSVLDQPVERYRPEFPAYEQVMLGRHEHGKATVTSLSRAIEHYQQAISLDANYALAYALMAASINRLNQIDPLVYEYNSSVSQIEAVSTLLEKALSISPLLSEAIALKGRIALQQRDYEQASELLISALQMNPNNADAQADIARVYLHANQLEKATLAAQEAVRLNPQDNNTQQLNARILWQSGRSEKAIAMIKNNLVLNPLASNNYSLLSRWSLQLGQPFEAVKFAHSEWQLEPDNPNKQWRLCISLLQIWHFELGIDCTEAVLELQPEYYEAKKWYFDLIAQPQALEAHIKQQIEKFPNVAYFQLQLVHEYDVQERWQESIDMLSALYPDLLSGAPALNDTNIWGARILGWAMMNSGQSEQGRLILESALAHIDTSRKLQSGGFTSGTDDIYILAALGRVDEALTRLEQAIDDDWIFYSFDFFPHSTVNSLDQHPKFQLLKARQAKKMQAYQLEVDAALMLNFRHDLVHTR